MIKIIQEQNNGNIMDPSFTGITSMELDINKLSSNKIKELDKYVRKCLLDSKSQEMKDIDKNFLGRKLKRDYDNEQLYKEENYGIKNISDINKKNEININNIYSNNSKNCFVIQTSITNPETPTSQIKNNQKIKFGKNNSLMVESDSDSDSSEEEDNSDFKFEGIKL